MNTKKLFALLAFSAFIAAPAMAQSTTDTQSQSSYDAKANGGYVAKEKSESTDAAGTTHEHKATKKLSVDANGNSKKTVDVKDSTDPKGLFNKTSTETKDTATEKNGVTTYSHTKDVNGTTTEDSTEKRQTP